MRYLSVCSGIEAATVAWHPLGWTPAAFSEIEAFPSAVLAHHYPDVPNVGDMTQIKGADHAIDLLVGGTPCQAFSVAGLRKGLADPRGNLALVYLGLVDAARPRWVVWENVPGVLSSNGGRDFGAFLGGLGQLGYGWAYRVLDAQFFGVAQRRRRVFVVGHLGGWQRAAAVLAERQGMSGDPAPSRHAGSNFAGCLSASLGRRGGVPDAGDTPGQLIATTVSPCIDASYGRTWGSNQWVDQGNCIVNAGVASTLTAREGKGADSDATTTLIPYGFRHWASAADGNPVLEDQVPALRSADMQGSAAAGGFGVRRLTPRECERLQGFPDDYTQVPYRGKPAADGPRYKAIGNSMAVPVMAWIGRRIAAVDAIAD